MIDFSDEFLAYLELKQDLLYHKIPTEKIAYFINEALQIGRVLADGFVVSSAKEFLAAHHIGIRLEEGTGEYFKVKFRAQFESDGKGNNQIILYKQSIEELAAANFLPYERMEEIILMHEIFHYLETHQSFETAERLDSVQTFQFLGMARTAKIQRTGEIAANSFAKDILQLPKLPSYYDYTYLLADGQITEQELRNELDQFAEIFQK